MVKKTNFLVMALISLAALHGQSDLATVTGNVRDPAQLAAPGVKVTIRNVETGVTRIVRTNGSGYFTVSNLVPGSYELTAETAGFRTFRETGIVLEIGQTLRSDVQLQVGEVTETITVSAGGAALNTENGALIGDVIVQKEIQELPLNARNFSDLAFLVPGVLPAAQGGTGTIATNGSRSDNTGFYVDGFDTYGSRGGFDLSPNLNAMQEFKMEVGGFSAEYGKMSGGIINMVLRSGTNRFHGSVFEYLRQDIFDARAYFDKEKSDLHFNQFGAVISGPVLLPGIYDGHNRTFFMFSFEGNRQAFGQSNLTFVPTELERAGNFTQSRDTLGRPVAVKDPFANNALFPGNVIPAARFTPASLKALAYYPLPNRNNTANNYIASGESYSNWESPLFKIDHRFNSKDGMAFRYGNRRTRSNNPFGTSQFEGIFGSEASDSRPLGGLDFTHLFTPTLLLEARAGVSRNVNSSRHLTQGQDFASQIGINGSTKDPDLMGFPVLVILNYSPLGAAVNEPTQAANSTYQAGGKIQWIHGKHALKLGLDVARRQYNQPFFNNARGIIVFQGLVTDHPMADFLIGQPQSSSITRQTARSYLRYWERGFFISDDYKITRSLTLNLGLRYEINNHPNDKYDRMSNFVPGLNKTVIASSKNVPDFEQSVRQAKLDNVVALSGDLGLPRSLAYTDYNNLAPRFGFAWRPFGQERTVIRGGYGIFYSGHGLNQFRLALTTGFPFSVQQSFNRVANNPNSLTLANPFPAATAALTGTTATSGYELHAPTGYMQSYNFTVERELGRGSILELGYAGSKGTHLGRQYDINAPIRTVEQYQATGTFPRPVPELAAINYWSFGSNSNYNSGAITLRKRASAGLFYRFSYVFSKSTDDASAFAVTSAGGFAGALDPRNLRLEHGRSDWDRTHAFSAAFSYELPFGRGRKVLSGAGKISNGIAGGWQWNATSSVYSGQAFTVQTANANLNIGESIRPNRLGSGLRSDIPSAGRRGVDYPFFNLSDFERVPSCNSRTTCLPSPHGLAPFGPGNSGRNILDGPGLAFVNMSLSKNVRVGENGRIQFRWETLNAFNHPNFQLPNRVFDAQNGGIISGVQSSGRGGPRTSQVGLQYVF